MAALQFIKSLILLVISPECYKIFFEEFDFTNGLCLKAAISKGLGLGIIAGSILVKVPQILKIVSAKSAEGLSLTANTLELVAILSGFSYNFVMQYPFSSYGDSAFLLIQTTIIASLILHYGGSPQKALLYLSVITAATAVLSSGSVPIKILWTLQAFNIPLVFTGKMMQVYSNYSQGSTGQLSAVMVSLLLAGSLARIFTSIQETGDQIIILTYCVASFSNLCLFSQIVYYWNVKSVTKGKKKTQ